MGKLVQVKATITEVNLPPLNLPYLAGETTTLTDKEYAALTTATQTAITVIASGLADPVRSKASTTPSTAADAYKLAVAYVNAAIQGLSTLDLTTPANSSFRLVADRNGLYPARPNAPAGHVVYVGPNQPSDWLDGDGWDNTNGI